MFTDYAKLFMALNKLRELGTSVLQTIFLTSGLFVQKSNTSLFIYRHGNNTAYLLLYVDDIFLTASSESLKTQLIDHLKSELSMTELG